MFEWVRACSIGALCINTLAFAGNFARDPDPLLEKQRQFGLTDTFPSLVGVQQYLKFLDANKLLGEQTVGTVFVSGGFASCKPGPNSVEIYKSLVDHLWTRAARGEYYRVVAACFAFDNQPIYYLTSDNPDQIYSGDVEKIAQVVNDQVKASGEQQAFVLGHSYGGWLAQQVALRIEEHYTLLGIATLDPISAVHCTPEIFTLAYLSSVVTQSPELDCNQAPRDITAPQIAQIKARSSWWLNFYQTNSSYLHSSAIPGADNRYIHYTFASPLAIMTAHASVDNDARVWHMISAQLRVFVD